MRKKCFVVKLKFYEKQKALVKMTFQEKAESAVKAISVRNRRPVDEKYNVKFINKF